ncbi:hypothetical protein niasHT_007335 [Heterodera trifolii]|uniref:Uncharacterized protein n=1 Tax=Heterodera trifolii TaxID=157864 RepID=A0ABD2LMY9_9BILA
MDVLINTPTAAEWNVRMNCTFDEDAKLRSRQLDIEAISTNSTATREDAISEEQKAESQPLVAKNTSKNDGQKELRSDHLLLLDIDFAQTTAQSPNEEGEDTTKD